MISDGRGGGGVIENLMKSDEGGRGGGQAKSDVRFSLFRKKEKKQTPSKQQANKQNYICIIS